MRAVKRIAVLVSGGGTNLQALIDAQRRGEIVGGEIAAVISSKPGAYALERARRAGIPGYVVSRKDYDTNQAMTAALVDKLSGLDIDLVVLAGCLVVIPDSIIREYRGRMINIHPSLIPSFCGTGYYGLKVHEEALKRGVKVTGATVHYVDEGTDTGPILLQKAVEVKPGDTPEILQRRVMEQCEWKLLPQAVSLLCQDRLRVEGRTVKIIGGRVIV